MGCILEEEEGEEEEGNVKQDPQIFWYSEGQDDSGECCRRIGFARGR